MIATTRIHGIARLRATFSANLRETMQRKNMSQSDLARAVWQEERTDKNGYAQPVGKDRISAYVNGRVLPTEATLAKIAEVLGVTKEILLGELDAPASSPEQPKDESQDLSVRITPHGTVTVIEFKITVQPSEVFNVMSAFKTLTDQYAIQKVKNNPAKDPNPTTTYAAHVE